MTESALRRDGPDFLLSDDDFGRLNIERLRRDGVDVGAIRIDPAQVTGSAFVRYRDDGERDFVFNIRNSASAGTRLDAAADRLLQHCRHLHVMGSSLFSDALVAAATEAASRVRARGGSVSFDPNMRKEMLRQPGVGDLGGRFDKLFPRFTDGFQVCEVGDFDRRYPPASARIGDVVLNCRVRIDSIAERHVVEAGGEFFGQFFQDPTAVGSDDIDVSHRLYVL